MNKIIKIDGENKEDSEINTLNTSNMNLCKIFPIEIVELIWKFVPLETKVWVSKEYYEKYHRLVIYPKIIIKYSSFIRYVVRENMYYVFQMHLNYYNDWLTLRNWKYQKQTFCNFADYVLFISSKNGKILYLLKEYEKEHCKNKHKNKRIKYTKWTN